MLRFTLLAVPLAASLLSLPAAATGKNPGVYASLEVRDAAACQSACTEDGLCMAWALYANSCELTAIVPVSAPANATAFALATRAPAFATLRPIAAPAHASVTPATPVAQGNQAQQAEEGLAEPHLSPEPDLGDDLVLLGGPEEGYLRSN